MIAIDDIAMRIVSFAPLTTQSGICRETRKNYLRYRNAANKIKGFVLFNTARIKELYWQLDEVNSQVTRVNVSRAFARIVWTDDERYWAMVAIRDGSVIIDDECREAATDFLVDEDPADLPAVFKFVISRCEYVHISMLEDSIYEYLSDEIDSDEDIDEVCESDFEFDDDDHRAIAEYAARIAAEDIFLSEVSEILNGVDELPNMVPNALDRALPAMTATWNIAAEAAEQLSNVDMLDVGSFGGSYM